MFPPRHPMGSGYGRRSNNPFTPNYNPRSNSNPFADPLQQERQARRSQQGFGNPYGAYGQNPYGSYQYGGGYGQQRTPHMFPEAEMNRRTTQMRDNYARQMRGEPVRGPYGSVDMNAGPGAFHGSMRGQMERLDRDIAEAARRFPNDPRLAEAVAGRGGLRHTLIDNELYFGVRGGAGGQGFGGGMRDGGSRRSGFGGPGW